MTHDGILYTKEELLDNWRRVFAEEADGSSEQAAVAGYVRCKHGLYHWIGMGKYTPCWCNGCSKDATRVSLVTQHTTEVTVLSIEAERVCKQIIDNIQATNDPGSVPIALLAWLGSREVIVIPQRDGDVYRLGPNAPEFVTYLSEKGIE